MTKREKIYETEIRPLIRQIIAIADQHSIPFVATFQVTANKPTRPNVLMSSWHLPRFTSEQIERGLSELVPGWEDVTPEDVERSRQSTSG